VILCEHIPYNGKVPEDILVAIQRPMTWRALCIWALAIDNLLERVMSRGFVDATGGKFSPDIIRVGATDATVSAKVKPVYAGGKVEDLMKMDPQVGDIDNTSSVCIVSTEICIFVPRLHIVGYLDVNITS